MNGVQAYRRLTCVAPPAPIAGLSAVVLAAGRGQRLSPLTDTTPKPLLPLLDLPLLLWMTARLRMAGLREVTANVHYLPEAFNEALEVCEECGPRLRLILESRPSGPLGGVLSCRENVLDSSSCLIISGDAVHDLDIPALVAAHRASGVDLTLTVKRVRDARRFGVIEVDDDGFVTRMREKPHDAQPFEFVSCGIYVLSVDRLARLVQPSFGTYDFVDLVAELLSARRPISTFQIDNWSDVGTPRDLLDINIDSLRSSRLEAVAGLASTEADGEVWTSDGAGAPQGVHVAGRAYIGEGVRIAPGVMLADAVIGAGSVVEADAVLARCLVMGRATVAAGRHVVEQVVPA